MSTAVVLYNLGGPDKPDDIRPFLFNLFNDPMIIGLPGPLRWMLAKLISGRREKTAREIYENLGGGSPLLANTRAQAEALETALNAEGGDSYKCFVAMRYWHPFIDEAVDAVLANGPDRIVLMPLYPQFSTTTVGSMMRVWDQATRKRNVSIPVSALCCYPTDPGFIAAVADGISQAVSDLPEGQPYRILFSAHGLPKKIIAKGDPYQWQVEQTANAVMSALSGRPGGDADWLCCYQSRVGPLEWIGPATEDEIKRAGTDGLGIVLVPTAFVSEHSETLVELDIEYRELADHAGVATYARVSTVGTEQSFIDGLARLIRANAKTGRVMCSGDGGRICGVEWSKCPAQILAKAT
jgi:ferrochelatase